MQKRTGVSSKERTKEAKNGSGKTKWQQYIAKEVRRKKLIEK
jgi:hypothetical protein